MLCRGKKHKGLSSLLFMCSSFLVNSSARKWRPQVEYLSVRWKPPTRLAAPPVITGNEGIVLKAVCCPIVSQAQACVGLFVVQHTQRPLCPLRHPSCSCEHLCPSQFSGSRIHSERRCKQHPQSGPSFSLGMSWTCRFLLPLRQEKQAKRGPLGCNGCTSALQRWGFSDQNFQSPHGVSIPSFLTQCRERWCPGVGRGFPQRQQSLMTTKHCVPLSTKWRDVQPGHLPRKP